MCVEKAIAIYHTTGAAVAGTSVVIPDPESLGNNFKSMTVVNDTDQDIKVEFKNSLGSDQAFIVPKSIKGYTKVLKNPLDNTTLKVKSMHVSAPAAGNITFNLS